MNEKEIQLIPFDKEMLKFNEEIKEFIKKTEEMIRDFRKKDKKEGKGVI
jgi:preprotein translocase subunit Sss1